LIAGQAPVPMGNDNFTAAPSGTSKTGNGLLNIAANTDTQFEALAKLIERPDLIGDQRFITRELRKRNRDMLTHQIEAALVHHSAKYWEDQLNRVGVPAGRVLSVGEALDLPQVKQRGLVRKVQGVNGLAEELGLVGGGYRYSDDPGPKDLRPPTLGQHTDEILHELGYDERAIDALRQRGDI
jgi:crotonobetainyl-CoA:carnitine CoA-transferase CaiB-like acyl-CoA transferase